jgi:hypothetical protein
VEKVSIEGIYFGPAILRYAVVKTPLLRKRFPQTTNQLTTNQDLATPNQDRSHDRSNPPATVA